MFEISQKLIDTASTIFLYVLSCSLNWRLIIIQLVHSIFKLTKCWLIAVHISLSYLNVQ
jgi:hypothetical protein